MASERFLVNPALKRRLSKSIHKRRRLATHSNIREMLHDNRHLHKNPIGEELMMIGMNPRRAHKRKMKHNDPDRLVGHNARKRRKKRTAKTVDVAAASVEVTRKRRKRRAKHALAATPKRTRRTRKHRKERVVSGRGRGRAARSLGLGGSIADIKSILPLAAIGGASIVATNIAPGLLKISNPYARYGVQAGVAILGGMGISRVNKNFGIVWAVSGLAVIIAGVIQTKLMSSLMPGSAIAAAAVTPAAVAGLSDEYVAPELMDMGAYEQVPGISDMSDMGYEGETDDEEQFGAYEQQTY